MFAAGYVVAFLWCFQTSAGQAELAKPEHVMVFSLNTQYTLSWDWDQSAAVNQAVTFTTQYIPKFKWKRQKDDWTTVCETPHTLCDLTALNLHYFGIFVLRIRANAGAHHSDWVLKDFCPDKHAALGPPSRVDLAPAGNSLDVSISDPLTNTNTSMRDMVSMIYYRLLYWERSPDSQGLRIRMVNSSANLVTLPDLKAWTWYCVSVQSRYDYYDKSSSFTAPHCMQTEGATPWWQILLYFLASLTVGFVVVLPLLYAAHRCYRFLKAAFYPSIALPANILEYLCDSSPGSDIPRLLESESELICDRVSICSAAVLLEIYTPPPSEVLTAPLSGLEQDSSGRHSRQGSGGSRDSGVYSTEGGSSRRQQQQPDSGHSSVGGNSSWQGPPSLEQLNMEDMGPEPKGEGHIVDEGVMDMCI